MSLFRSMGSGDLSNEQILVAPPRTSPPLVNKINADLHAVLAEPDVSDKYAELNTTTRNYSPDQGTEFIHAEQRLKLNEEH